MGKEQFIKALNCMNEKHEVPFWELEFHLWNKFSKKKFIVGEEFAQLTAKEKEFALHQNADIITQVSKKLNFSAVTVPGGYWEIAPGKPAYYWLSDEERFRQTTILLEKLGNEIALVVNTGGIMAIPEAQRYMEFSCLMFEDPKAVEKEAKQLYESSVLTIDKYREIGIDIFLTASDIADNSGAYFAPDQFNRFILPFLHKWSDHIQAIDAYSILHTDGNINLYINEIAQTSLNALQAIDPLAGMDIYKIKKDLGDKLCLCGNLDCSLIITGNPDDIYAEAKKLLSQMGEFRGYSFGASNVLEENTSKNNFLAVFKAYNDYISDK